LQEREGKYRGIINSISYFLRNYDISQVVGVIDIMSSLGKITGALHVVLMTSGMHDSYIENTMKHECEGVIEFRMLERGSEIERSILIRKMRGIIAPDRTISYILIRKGIELETTTLVL
jgi:flagellar protein FlaH